MLTNMCLLGFALPILLLGVIRLVILLLTNPVRAFIGTVKITLYLTNPIRGVFRLAKRRSNPLPRVLGWIYYLSGPDLNSLVFNLMNSSFEPVRIESNGLASVLSVNNIIPLFRIQSNVLVPCLVQHAFLIQIWRIK